MAPAPAATLLLADGTRLHGGLIGTPGTAVGELCFNTGMTGYQEIFSDPSYRGQILVTTHSHIGNYGTVPDEVESDRVQIAGLVCRNFSRVFSRFGATRSLEDWFLEQGLTGLSGVDTRALVNHLRERGAMNAIISSETHDPAELAQELARRATDMQGRELSSEVSTPEAYALGVTGPLVAVLDYGVKRNILLSLLRRGCRLRVYPSKTTAEAILADNPQGIVLSNGPGDPAAMPHEVAQVQRLLAQGLPLFGICMGHQLLARACGIGTYKLHFGHRGINHPVLNLATGRTEITSQNHGFGVERASLEATPEVELTHVNLNDQTVEGLRLRECPAFSVQYHPESNPGPHDSAYLFDQFVGLLA